MRPLAAIGAAALPLLMLFAATDVDRLPPVVPIAVTTLLVL